MRRFTIATGPVSGIPALRAHDAVAGDFVAVALLRHPAGGHDLFPVAAEADHILAITEPLT